MLSKELKLTQLPCHPTPALTTPPLPPAPLAPLPWTPWCPPAASSVWPPTSASSRPPFCSALPSLPCPWSLLVPPAPPLLPLGFCFLAAGLSPAGGRRFPAPTTALCCCRPLPPSPTFSAATTPGPCSHPLRLLPLPTPLHPPPQPHLLLCPGSRTLEPSLRPRPLAQHRPEPSSPHISHISFSQPSTHDRF
jgi:hypothetical protein